MCSHGAGADQIAGPAEFQVSGGGDLEGVGECYLPQNNQATFVWSGQLTADGELMDGEVVMTTPNTGTTEWWLEGGIWEEQGEVYVYVWWEPKFGGGDGGGGSGFYGEAWGVR